MQIKVHRDELLKPLSYVAGVVERRQTLPVLSYLLMQITDGALALTGTDLEVEVTVRTRAGTNGQGEMLVPARKLLDICRALPADTELEMRKEASKVVVKAGRSRFSLATLPVADFPNIQTANWEVTVGVGQRDLRNLLEQTHFCMAQQDVRYYLNGVLIETVKGGLRAVATDGHRMAVGECKVGKAAKAERQVILPRKGVHELIRVLEDSEEPVEIEIGTNHLRARTDNLVFTSKLIDGRYPDYEKVIPTNQSKVLELDREPLREALARVAILSNEKYRGVRLSLAPKSLRVTAHNPEQEEATEEIAIDYHNEALEIGFNVSYLIESLNALRSTKVLVGLHDANSSCSLRMPDRTHPLYVVMPMRL